MDQRDKLTDHIGAGIIACALGFSITMMICGALAVTAGAWSVLSACVAVTAICVIGTTSKKGAIAAGALAVAMLIFLSVSPVKLFSSIGGLFSQMAALYSGGEASIQSFSSALGVIISVVLTAFLYWLTDMDGGVYPAIALCVVLLMCVWLLGRSLDTFYAFVAAAALVCMFARASDDGASYVKAVPAAIIVAALAIAMLPAGNPTYPPLEQAAQKVRDMFNDYFFFTDPRTTYSISADGFQQMGEMLGGPAEPNMGNVMVVETDDTLFLRGSIKRTYTTYAWTESAINSRYVFIDPLRRQVRDEVFDVDKLKNLNASAAFKRVNAFVTVVSEGISTLFVPHRLIDLEIPLDLATYFSTSGEVFITRGVVPSDTYGITAYIPTGNTQAMRAVANEAAKMQDSEFETVKQQYTSLPAGIDDNVYRLAQSVTNSAITPYDKALALERHLIENYKYSLKVKYPPRDQDFVSNFLLKTKKGYCSYFASAMAVMARMVGLPSRYVEGYMVPARSTGTTLVTGKNAHAWVEIYFQGLGWVTFNPTPGSGDDYGSSGGADESDGDGGDATQGDASEGDDAQPTPTPDPGTDGQTDEPNEPDAGETPPPEDGQDPQADDQPEDAPPEEPPAEEPPTDEPQPDENPEDDRPNLWFLAILLPLLALAAIIVKRLRDSDPRAMTRGLKNTQDKLLTWYRAILLALEYQGQTPEPGETPGKFADRLIKQKLADPSLVAVSNQISLNSYAGKRPDATALKQARLSYAKLVKQLKPIERARWLCHRVTKGIGDTANIP